MYEENFCIKRIRELMELNGFNPYRLAKKSGISLATLNSMFAKNTEPHIETIRKICSAFEITVAQFFDRSSRDMTERQEYLLDTFNQLPRKEQENLLSYLNYLFENSRN